MNQGYIPPPKKEQNAQHTYQHVCTWYQPAPNIRICRYLCTNVQPVDAHVWRQLHLSAVARFSDSYCIFYVGRTRQYGKFLSRDFWRLYFLVYGGPRKLWNKYGPSTYSYELVRADNPKKMSATNAACNTNSSVTYVFDIMLTAVNSGRGWHSQFFC